MVDRGELGNRPWFVMPRAMELREHLGSRPHLRDVVKVVAAVADTLARVVTDQDVAHRDLKPANLLWLNGPLVADFGIAQLPTRAGITQKGESVGPMEFLAPEMRYVVGDVDGKAADVWSLAKTLFVLARVNDEKWPPVGTLNAGRPEFSLRPAGGRAAADLEFLLEAATAYPAWSEHADVRPRVKGLAGHPSGGHRAPAGTAETKPGESPAVRRPRGPSRRCPVAPTQ